MQQPEQSLGLYGVVTQASLSKHLQKCVHLYSFQEGGEVPALLTEGVLQSRISTHQSLHVSVFLLLTPPSNRCVSRLGVVPQLFSLG